MKLPILLLDKTRTKVNCKVKPREPEAMPKKPFDTMDQSTEEQVQCPEDQRAPGYDNNTKGGWLVGKAGDATRMPHYDRSPKFYKTGK
jgi:hypothetical protein